MISDTYAPQAINDLFAQHGLRIDSEVIISFWRRGRRGEYDWVFEGNNKTLTLKETICITPDRVGLSYFVAYTSQKRYGAWPRSHRQWIWDESDGIRWDLAYEWHISIPLQDTESELALELLGAVI